MTAVFPVGLGTAACKGPKYFLLCSYLPFGFVNVKFAPETVEALVRLGTEVWTRLPRVVAMGLAARWRAPLVSEAAPRFARGDGSGARGDCAGLNSASCV